jgi:hypothetical protein
VAADDAGADARADDAGADAPADALAGADGRGLGAADAPADARADDAGTVDDLADVRRPRVPPG